MPQIPGLTEARINAGPASYGRRASGGDFGAAEAEAAGQRGQAVAGIGSAAVGFDRVLQAAQEADLALASAEVSAGLDKAVFELAVDPDIDTHEERFAKTRDGIVKQAQEKLPQSMRGRLEDRVFPASAHAALEVSSHVRTKRIDTARDKLDQALTLSSDQAAQTPDPVRRGQIRGQTVGSLDAALAGGILDQGMYDKAVRRFDRGVSEADLRRMIRENPSGAFKRLGEPKDPIAAGFTAAEREEFRTQALTEVEQQMAQGRAEASFRQAQADRAEREAADVAQRNADDALMKGDIGALNEILDRARNVLTPEQRRWYLERIAKGGGMAGDTPHTNPGVYVDLATRAARGDAVPDEIDGAYRAGGITREDRDRLFKASEDRRFGEVQEFIRHATTQGQFDFDPSRQLKSAEVQRQFQEWSAAHPDATATEALEQGRGLLRAVGIKDGAALIRPSDPTGPDGKVDVGPLIQQALDRAQRGDLNPAELGAELKHLKDLEQAQQRAGSTK